VKYGSLAPLGFVFMLTTFCHTVPRCVIEHYLGERPLGVYGVLDLFGAAMAVSITNLVLLAGQSAVIAYALCQAARDVSALSTSSGIEVMSHVGGGAEL